MRPPTDPAAPTGEVAEAHEHHRDGHHPHSEGHQSSNDGAIHDNSWSINLEHPRYADDPERAIADGIDAIERTTPGNHVNLVTHAALGHPSAYLYPTLEKRYEGGVEWEYVEQCGCGGHVTRVHVGSR